MTHIVRIPVWMTEPQAEELSLSETPLIDVKHLLDIAKTAKAMILNPGDNCDNLLDANRKKEELRNVKKRRQADDTFNRAPENDSGVSAANQKRTRTTDR
ncbi:MAG: hypothetical protein GY847_27675 [Proteobacteria bacterium]|nr:hypothetical protein [Pseudomonadota bacterium]